MQPCQLLFGQLIYLILMKKDKLDRYGIRNVALNLIKSYLSNRKQYVDINDAKSHTLNITTGEPQSEIFNCVMYATLSTTLRSIYLSDPNEEGQVRSVWNKKRSFTFN